MGRDRAEDSRLRHRWWVTTQRPQECDKTAQGNAMFHHCGLMADADDQAVCRAPLPGWCAGRRCGQPGAARIPRARRAGAHREPPQALALPPPAGLATPTKPTFKGKRALASAHHSRSRALPPSVGPVFAINLFWSEPCPGQAAADHLRCRDARHHREAAHPRPQGPVIHPRAAQPLRSLPPWI